MSRFATSRRGFVRGAAGAVIGATLLSAHRTARAEAASFDPSFASAHAALTALRRKAISSRELVAHSFQRIRRHNPQINAFVTLLEAQALSEAERADALRAQRRPLGALHGLPVVVKDAFATAGVRTTGGSKKLADFVPTDDAVVVARLKQAGAIIIGKTNLPEWSGDWQSYNQVAGQTNNPWDLARTPGGSTGGGAAALAAGLAFLEVGSDLSGSIRIPSHFCGIYGHKPTYALVPNRGHVPPGPLNVPTSPLAVAGPLARSAEDLQLALSVLAGPAGDDAIGYRLSLPKPRRTRLHDYKLGFVLDDPYCPLDSPVRDVLAELLEKLRKSGMVLREGWPTELDPAAAYNTYMFMLGVTQSPNFGPERRAQLNSWRTGGIKHPWVLGATATHLEWGERYQELLRHRAVWQRYFREFDGFLSAVDFVAAFEHNHRSDDITTRTLMTSQGRRPYVEQSKLVALAALSGCPATAFPVGRTREGLPVGMQVMGAYLEDATTLDVAAKLGEIYGGFVPPPGVV